jgi:glycosyltransferase involved in cell wall biosynthesis
MRSEASSYERPPMGLSTTDILPRTYSSGVSLCMIVKNEEDNLPACLRSVADLVDEIIIVDTGSIDRTREIAKEFGAQLFDFHWIDSFAAARNESLRHASKQWIFWMDADDRLDEHNRQRFKQWRSQLTDGTRAFVMKCLCLPDKVTGASTIVDHIRAFPNNPNVRWKYRIHEQILPAVRKLGGEVLWTDVVIHHVGYQDPDVRTKKRQRDFRLLQIENNEHPDDPFTLFNLGQLHQEVGEIDKAFYCFRRSLSLSNPQDSIVRKLYSLLTQLLRTKGQLTEALKTCHDGQKHYPNDPEILFQEGLCRQQMNDWRGADSCYRQIIELPDSKFFASSDPALRGYKSYHNLAVIARELKNDAAAEKYWRMALAENESFEPSLASLADFYLSHARWTELDPIIQKLLADRATKLLGGLFEGRRYLAKNELDAALQCLLALSSEYPDAFGPKVFLSHVYLKQEKWVDAEKALRDVLAADPANAEARKNLELLAKRGLSAEVTEAPLVSMCMIVRNEERHLARCLLSCRDLVDELIIADTGSNDRTLQVASEFKAMVVRAPWTDSFAEARNASIKPARGKWIFYLDADEYLDSQAREEFRRLRQELSLSCVYMMKQVSDKDYLPGRRFVSDQARLFPNLPGLKWRFRVHEQILPFLLHKGLSPTRTSLEIQHSGLADLASVERKAKRNLHLAILDLRDHPKSGFIWFNRGGCHLDLGQNEMAVACLHKAVQHTNPKASLAPHIYALLSLALRRLNAFADADRVLEIGLTRFPGNIELLLERGIVLTKLNRPEEAGECLQGVVDSPTTGPAFGIAPIHLVADARNHLAELARLSPKSPEQVS